MGECSFRQRLIGAPWGTKLLLNTKNGLEGPNCLKNSKSADLSERRACGTTCFKPPSNKVRNPNTSKPSKPSKPNSSVTEPAC